MKLKLLVTAAALTFSVQSHGAIYTVSNLITGGPSSDALYQNLDNTLSSGGIVALGYFAQGYVPSSNLATIATTISDFTIAASALTASFSEQLQSPGLAGYVDAASLDTANITGTDTRIGRPLYVFFGNGATLGTSTAWALKQVATIADDLPNELTYLANPFGGAAPIIGSIGTFTGDPGTGVGGTFSTLKLATVPEPSAALLGAIGALGLLRRRRN